MSHDIDYAFLSRIDAVTQPTVASSLGALAALIHRRRHGQAIRLEEIQGLHEQRRMASGRGPAAPHGLHDRGVKVIALMLDGTDDRTLGFAWLRGGGREALQAALTRAALTVPAQRHPAAYAA